MQYKSNNWSLPYCSAISSLVVAGQDSMEEVVKEVQEGEEEAVEEEAGEDEEAVKDEEEKKNEWHVESIKLWEQT